jgi:hypothetical protein
LAAFLDHSTLTAFKTASWTNRSMSGNRGNLDGSITTDSGGVVPIKFVILKGGRVLQLQFWTGARGTAKDRDALRLVARKAAAAF